MNKMKKLLSSLLALSMVLSYVPMPAVAEEVCTHHVHDDKCGYVQAVEGKSCTHQCTESCPKKDVTVCVHDHVKLGCAHTPAVEGVACDHVHGEVCGYVPAQAAVPCTCGAVAAHTAQCASLVTEGAECDCGMPTLHAEGCEPKAAVAEQCSHVHGACAYKAAVQESWGCGHVCTKDSGCVKAVCAHAHDASCGYVQAMKGSDCTFVCTECKAEEKTCTCGAAEEGEDEHAPFCDLYVRTYEECKCVLDCAVEGLNDYCEACHFGGVEACTGGEEEQIAYATSGIIGSLSWKLDDNGVLTISGSGVIPDYRMVAQRPYYSITSQIKEIVIESGVTAIGNLAFSGCENLKKLTIKGDITRIGARAFAQCSAITEITYCGVNAPSDLGANIWVNGLDISVAVPENYAKGVETFAYLSVSRTLPATGGEAETPTYEVKIVGHTTDTGVAVKSIISDGVPAERATHGKDLTVVLEITGEGTVDEVYVRYIEIGTEGYYLADEDCPATLDAETLTVTIPGNLVDGTVAIDTGIMLNVIVNLEGGYLKDTNYGKRWYDADPSDDVVALSKDYAFYGYGGNWAWNDCFARNGYILKEITSNLAQHGPYDPDREVGPVLERDMELTLVWEECTEHNYVNGTCEHCGQAQHTHNWTYTAVGKSITATCGNADGCCTNPNGGSVTISASDATYDGTAKAASLSADSIGGIGELSVVYEGLSSAPVNAGTYTASLTVDGKTISVTYTIAKKGMSIKADDQTIPYGGTLDNTKITNTGLIDGHSVTVTLIPSITAVGTGEITPSAAVIKAGDVDVTANYEITYENGALTITKASTSIAFNGYAPGKTYDGQPLANPTAEQLTITGAAYSDVTFTWYAGSVAEENKLTSAPSDAGTYYVVASIAETANTTASSATSETITIDKLDISGAAITLGTALTYTSEAQTQTVAKVEKNGLEVTYTVEGNTGTEVKNDYILTVTGTGNFTGTATTTWSIGKAAPSYTVPTGLTATYGQTLANVTLPTGWAWKDGSASVGNAGTRTFKALYNPDSNNYNTVEADVTIEVAKALIDIYTDNLINPEFAEGLIYNGTAQALVTNSGSIDGGYIVFSLNPDGEYTTEIPVATEAGEYVVYYRIEGDENHYWEGSSAFEAVTIAKANPEYTVPTGLTATYGDTLANVVLPDGWTWKDAETTFVGNAGTGTFKALYNPDSNNYNTVEADVTIEVAKADPEYTVPTGLTATYGNTLADVELPAGWTWKDAETTSVGNAGTSTFKALYNPDSNNYNTVEADVTIEVAKAEIDGSTLINPEFAKGLIYNGTAQALVTKIGSVDGGYIVYSLSIDGEYTTTIPVATEAGTYRVYWTIECDENHYVDGTPGSSRVTIAAKDASNATVTLDDTSVQFDGTAKTPGVTSVIVDGKTLNAETDYEVSYRDNTYVGTATVTITFKGNYTGNARSATFTIVRAAAPAIQWPTAGSLTYGQKLSESTLTSEDANGTFAWENGEQIPTVTNSGYVVVYTPKDTVNYDYSGVTLTQTIPVTVSKAPASVETAPAANTLIYTGEAQALVTAGTAKGGKLVYSLSENGTYTETIPTGTNAGEYTVWYYVDGDYNHSDSAKASVKVTIAKAKAEITVDTTPITVTYGETVELPDATSNFGTVSCDKTAAELVNAGTYTVTYTVEGTDNYEGDSKNIEVIVSPKSVTVKADAVSKTYGEADPELIYTATGLVGEDKLSGKLTRAKGENVGTYAITQGTLTAGDNYTITYIGAELTINAKTITDDDVELNGSLVYTGSELTQAVTVTAGVTYEVTGNKATNVGTYELTVKGTGNYTGEVKLSWNIKAAAATVETVPEANDLTYTGEAQTLVTAGTANGGKVVYSLTKDGEYTETIPTGTNAGDYTVWYYVQGDANHSDSAKASVKVTIAKAKAEITMDTDPITVTYGEAVMLPTATANFGEVDCDKTAAELVNAGTYTVTYTVEGTDNYDGDTETVTVTIEKLAVAEPTVTGTYTYTGTEQTVALAGIESCMTIASGNKATNTGSYEVVLTLDGNHKWADGSDGKVQWNIAKAKAEITVDPDPITVIYGETVTLPTVTTNFGTVVCDKTAADLVNAGTYTVTYIVAGTDNYDGDTKTVTVTINPKTITEADVALDGSLVYTGEEQTQAVNVTDGITYEISDNKATNVGTYELTVKGTGNYTGEVKLSWSIKPAAATVATAPTAKTLTYTGEAQALVTAGTANGGEMQYSTDNQTWSTTIPSGTNAGEYTVYYKVAGDANHTDTDVQSVVVNIAKAAYDMTGAKWNYTDAIQYDGKQHTVEVIGLPAGVTVSGYTGNNAERVGEYTAKVTFSYDTVNYEAPALADLTWTIINDWTPTEYTVTHANSEGWLNEDFTLTAQDGYLISSANSADGEWKAALTFSADTDNGSVTFYLKNTKTGAISLEKTETYKIDKTPATGKITIGELTGWEAFVNSISFNLFFKDMQTVTITSADTGSGVQSVEYYASATAMTLEEVEAVTDWSSYNGGVNVPLEDAKKFVYFAKITDKAGNVTYLSTDGAVYDTAAPVIGIEPGTYYTTQTVTVTEANLDTLTLNGKAVTSPITLDGDKDTTYTIVAKDKAGHQVTVTVTMKTIASLDDSIGDLNENNVTSADREDIQDVLDGVNELLEDQNLPQAEKDRLEDIKEEAEGLLDTIDAAADAVDTEDIQKVEDKNSSNVKPEDKKDLEKAKEDLEDALKEENKGNYTEAEQQEIQKELDRINAALATIEQTEAVEAAIDALPKSVEPDLDEKTEKSIRDAKAAYDKLNDHQKSLISKTHKEKLEKLFDTLDDYKIIKGSGKKWEKGSGKSFTFTANGPDRKFKELRIDGYVVDTSNYTHKDGSTIITLKASYLQNLSTGKHTIQVVYTDGATDGKDTFRICNSGSNPATGDDMNMMLSGGIMITSLFCLAMMAMFIRRKKDRYER